MKKNQTQTFNDGVCGIYSVINIAPKGEKQEDGLKIKHNAIRYDRRTVGVTRFWTAKQDNTKIDQLIRIQLLNDVERHNVVMLADGKQYRIKQIQYPKEIVPSSMDISLERIETKYQISDGGG